MVLYYNPYETESCFKIGRMAYVIDLDEEGETDIPTTLVRSKLDVPSTETNQTISTNDIVINKLTEILSYLRHSSKKNRKLTKKSQVEGDSRVKVDEKKSTSAAAADSIYDDIGEYKPHSKSSGSKSSSSQRLDRNKKSSYFPESVIDKEAKEAEMKREKALKIARFVFGLLKLNSKLQTPILKKSKKSNKNKICSIMSSFKGDLKSKKVVRQ